MELLRQAVARGPVWYDLAGRASRGPGVRPMAGAILGDTGLTWALGAVLGERLFVRLYRNDVFPGKTSTLGDFLAAAFPGYVDIELTSLWPAPAIDVNGSAASAPVDVMWTRGVGGVAETDYGWILYANPDPFSVYVAGRRQPIPWFTSLPGDHVQLRLSAFLLRG